MKKLLSITLLSLYFNYANAGYGYKTKICNYSKHNITVSISDVKAWSYTENFEKVNPITPTKVESRMCSNEIYTESWSNYFAWFVINISPTIAQVKNSKVLLKHFQRGNFKLTDEVKNKTFHDGEYYNDDMIISTNNGYIDFNHFKYEGDFTWSFVININDIPETINDIPHATDGTDFRDNLKNIINVDDPICKNISYNPNTNILSAACANIDKVKEKYYVDSSDYKNTSIDYKKCSMKTPVYVNHESGELYCL